MSEKKVKEQSLSEKFNELEEITQKFENGEIDLEQGIPQFKKGLLIAKELKTRLNELENEIEEIKAEFKDLEDTQEIDKTQKTTKNDMDSELDIDLDLEDLLP